jgi:thioredoxin 1
MGSVNDVTDANFDHEVMTSAVPVLVDFWGPSCAPCKAIAPHLDTLAVESDGKLKVVKINIHANMKAAMKFGIKAIPTFVVLKGGREVARQQGTQGGLQGLRKLVENHLG